MILTSLVAALVLSHQAPGTAKAVPTPPVRMESARLLVKRDTAKRLFEQVGKSLPSGVGALSYGQEDQTLFVRATRMGLDTVRDLIDRIENPRVLRRFVVQNAAIATVHKALMLHPIVGIDFLSYDPTDNTIVARGTEKALESLGARLKDLDRIDA